MQSSGHSNLTQSGIAESFNCIRKVTNAIYNMFRWDATNLLPNGISIGSAVFARPSGASERETDPHSPRNVRHLFMM